MAVVIASPPTTANRPWASSCASCCAPPGGAGLCCYSCCCPCCAAGDVAKAANRDYCMSCCVVPFLLPCVLPCWLSSDRSAFAQRWGIMDSFGWCTSCLLFCCGCHCCLFIQELNTLKQFEMSGVQPVIGAIGSTGGGQPTVVVIPSAAPQQQGMAAAPQPAYGMSPQQQRV